MKTPTQEQALAQVAAKERRATPGLTARQDELLAILRAKEAAGERTPSYRELTDMLGLRSTSGVNRLVGALVERGFIRRQPCNARSITLVEQHPAAILLNFSDRDLIREIKARGYQVEAIR